MANLYWNGTGYWGSNANWFYDDLHTSGATAPAATDNVFFTSNSSTGTCTLNVFPSVVDINMSGFTGTFNALSSSYSITCSGNAYFSGTPSYNGQIIFTSALTGRTITSNGIPFSQVTFNGFGGWILQDYFISTTNFNFLKGNLNSNNQTLALNRVSAGNSGAARILNLGTSEIWCTQWTLSQGDSLLSFTGDTSFIHLSGSNVQFSGGDRVYNKVYFENAFTSALLAHNNTFNELKIIPISSQSCYLQTTGNQIINSNLTISGRTQQYRILMYSDVQGVPRTYTCNGSLNISDIDFVDIIGTGTTSWTGTRLGNAGGDSGITFDAPRTLYWVGVSGGTWSNNSNWALSIGGVGGQDLPRCQDDVEFVKESILLAGKTITMDCNIVGKNVFFREFTTNPALSGSFGAQLSFFGSFSMCTGMTFSTSVNRLIWRGRGNYTITTTGKNMSSSNIVQCYGGKYTLLDSFNASGGNINLSSGVLDTNNQDVNVISIGQTTDLVTSGIKLGSSNIYLYGSSSTIQVINFNSNFISLSADTSLIKLVGVFNYATTTGNIFFTGGGKTYNNVWFSKPTSGNTLTIQQSNTFNNLILTPESFTGIKHLVKFTNSTTQTFTGFTAQGSSGRTIFLTGTAAGGTWSLLKTGTGKTCCDYLDLSGSTASPSNTFYAGVNSTNSGGNTGWLFTSCTQIKAVLEVLYSSAVSKVSQVATNVISKISGLS